MESLKGSSLKVRFFVCQFYLPVVTVFAGSNSSLMECGEMVFSKGVPDLAGAGVATRSADSLLDLSIVVVVGG